MLQLPCLDVGSCRVTGVSPGGPGRGGVVPAGGGGPPGLAGPGPHREVPGPHGWGQTAGQHGTGAPLWCPYITHTYRSNSAWTLTIVIVQPENLFLCNC